MDLIGNYNTLSIDNKKKKFRFPEQYRMSQQVTCMYNSSNKEIMQSKANTEIHECGWCWEPIVRVGGSSS